MTLRPWQAGALLCGAIHLLFVVAPLLASGGHGEGQAFLVSLADFPLVFLLDRVPGGGHILYDSTPAYLSFFAVAGTLMYAGIGAAFGALCGFLLGLIRK